MEGMARPARDSMRASRSRKSQLRRAASRRPTVVLPAPMKPVRTMRRRWAGRRSAVAGLGLGLTLGSAIWTFMRGSFIINATDKTKAATIAGRGSVELADAEENLSIQM